MNKTEILLVLATASTTVSVTLVLSGLAKGVKRLGKAVERKAVELTETDVTPAPAPVRNKYAGRPHPKWIVDL